MTGRDAAPVALSALAPLAGAAAVRLARAGAGPGRPVAVRARSSRAVAALAWAAGTLGAPVMPLDPDLPDTVAAELMRSAGVALAVAGHPVPGVPVLTPDEALAPPHGPPAPGWTLPQGVALLIATSGSSGRPRAVMLTGAGLAASARAGAARAPLGPGDRWLACLPLFHVGGFSILTRCALAGAEAVLTEGFDAHAVQAALAAERITHLSVVPAMLARLAATGDGRPPASLRHVLAGGAALDPGLARRAADLGWPVQPTYGLSETGSQIATLPSLPAHWAPGFVGPPLPGVEVATAADGRLRVRGPMLMAGYANPGLVPGEGLEDGWFTTSDLARIGPDGALTILGRADDVIVTGGEKVMPALAEAAAARAPGVAELAVAGRPDPDWGAVVVAVYAGEVEPPALLAWCRAAIAGPMRPRAAVRVAALPRLANGKPDRSAIARLARGEAGVEAEPGTRG